MRQKIPRTMKIFIGRFDLLPEDWEGINGLNEKKESEIKAEVRRQQALVVADDEMSGNDDYDYIDEYTQKEFEDTFNHSTSSFISSEHYWIKIF